MDGLCAREFACAAARFRVEGDVAHRVGHARGPQAREVEQATVGQMRRHYLRERVEHGLRAARRLALPLPQHGLDLFALRILLAAAQSAGNERKGAQLGPALQIGLFHIGQRADDHMTAVVTHQLGRHALELAAEEQIEEKGFENIVPVVAEGDLGRPQLARHAVENAASQPRAQSAGGLALGDDGLDDGIGVLLLDVKGHAAALEIVGQHLLREAGLLLVEVDGH